MPRLGVTVAPTGVEVRCALTETGFDFAAVRQSARLDLVCPKTAWTDFKARRSFLSVKLMRAAGGSQIFCVLI